MAMLKHKAGIVTGAARGFGRASAERLCEEGARVALVDVNADGVRQAAAELTAKGHAVIAIVADVADEAATERMMRETETAFGRIDFIHQNAAIQVEKLLHETTPADWDRLMSVNLRSMFLGARAVLPRMMMAGGGAIVNSASILSLSADQI